MYFSQGPHIAIRLEWEARKMGFYACEYKLGFRLSWFFFFFFCYNYSQLQFSLLQRGEITSGLTRFLLGRTLWRKRFWVFQFLQSVLFSLMEKHNTVIIITDLLPQWLRSRFSPVTLTNHLSHRVSHVYVFQHNSQANRILFIFLFQDSEGIKHPSKFPARGHWVTDWTQGGQMRLLLH